VHAAETSEPSGIPHHWPVAAEPSSRPNTLGQLVIAIQVLRRTW